MHHPSPPGVGKMDELFDLDLPQRYQEEGYRDGINVGKQRGFEEGYILGGEEGLKLGTELGSIAGHLYRILLEHEDSLSENIAKKISKSLRDILFVSLKNLEDSEKGVQLARIRGAYKEFCTILNLSFSPGAPISEKSKLEF
jgi:hypothetical protein